MVLNEPKKIAKLKKRNLNEDRQNLPEGYSLYLLNFGDLFPTIEDKILEVVNKFEKVTPDKKRDVVKDIESGRDMFFKDVKDSKFLPSEIAMIYHAWYSFRKYDDKKFKNSTAKDLIYSLEFMRGLFNKSEFYYFNQRMLNELSVYELKILYSIFRNETLTTKEIFKSVKKMGVSNRSIFFKSLKSLKTKEYVGFEKKSKGFGSPPVFIYFINADGIRERFRLNSVASHLITFFASIEAKYGT